MPRSKMKANHIHMEQDFGFQLDFLLTVVTSTGYLASLPRWT